MTRQAEIPSSLWPTVENLVPPDLPPEIAVARLVGLARSLLIENRELRDALNLADRGAHRAGELVGALRPAARDGVEAA